MIASVLHRAALGTGLLLVMQPLMQQSEGVRVCVGADRILRYESGGRCRPGESEYVLAKAVPKLDGADVAESERATETLRQMGQIADLQGRIAVLTQRIANLEQTASSGNARPAGGNSNARPASNGHRVVAPFQVVDAAGVPIFEVRTAPRGFRVLTAAGQGVAFGTALEGGGFFKGTSVDTMVQSVIGVDGHVGLVRVKKGGTILGTLAVLEDGKSAFELANDDGVSVVSLMPGASGGGRLQLGDAAGNAMVEAGITAGGVGLVRTYPLGSPGAGLVGMPGTFIIGRQGK